MEQQAAPTETNRQSNLIPTTIAILAIVVGLVLRAIEFMRDRPLWLDEAMLSLNIAARTMGQLARPLDYDQSAPLLYLWIERLAVTLGGVSERSLRVLPFVAGIALIPLVWIVARRFAGVTTAAIAAVLVALSVSLVSFSAEAKQYGVDPIATVAIVWLAVRVMNSPDDRRVWIQLVLGGVGCLLLSQPAVFVLGGAACMLAVDHSVRRSAVARRYALVAAAAWSLMFVALYVAIYGATAHSAYMRAFWEGTFLDPRAPDFMLRLQMFSIAAFSAPALTGSMGAPQWLMTLAWLLGLATLWRRRPSACVIVAIPVAIAVLACAAGYYAVMDRLFLFAAPLTLVAYASLLAMVIESAPARARNIALAGVAAVLTLIVAPTHVRRVAQPVFYGVGKQVVADVDSMSRGEPVYIAARSFPVWMFYTTDWRAPDEGRLRWAASIAGAGAPAHNNAPSRGGVRADEARTLARSYRGRVEIVGIPTGRQYRTSSRTMDAKLLAAEYALPLLPDTGWAELEVNRMASVARPRLWVFGSHMFALDGAEPSLVAELQRRGVRLLMERRQGSTVAYHVEFPSEP